MSRDDWRRPEKFNATEGRRRIGLVVSYDGRAFCGWQSQENGVSVQQTILDAVKKFTGQENVEICGSGRTDSGVHAWGQVAHAEIDDNSIPASAFCPGLNALLPFQVRIKQSWEAGREFHARYSAMAREYRYFCKLNPGHDAFDEGLVTCLKKMPDIDVLNSYACQIVGTHDFTTFACSKDICPSKVRDIYESVFSFTKSEFGEDILVYKVCGNAFLYHMVRSLVGTMIEMALNGKSADDFKNILDGANRSLCGKTAPSDGLYLWRVSYDPEEYLWFEEKYGR